MSDDGNLDRFVEAHHAQFQSALLELESGQKKTHWMWFIFPIVEGLGESERSLYYAIRSLAGARSFIEHDYLGANYRKCLQAVLSHTDKTAVEIFGRTDKMKLQSSVTLFRHVAKMPSLKVELDTCLRQYFDGNVCERTVEFLKNIDA